MRSRTVAIRLRPFGLCRHKTTSDSPASLPWTVSMRFRGMRSTRWYVALAAIASVVTLGCGGSAIDPATAKNLKAISELYCDFAFSHGNAGPSDEQALKKHVRAMDKR